MKRLDCVTCARRETCENEKPGTFCTRWTSGRGAAKKEPDDWNDEDGGD